MSQLIVGITGRARAGKDTVAQALCDRGFTRVAFADPLRDVLLAANPLVNLGTYQTWPLSEVVRTYGWERAKEFRTVRRLLQNLGTAVREHISESAWVDRAWVDVLGAPGDVVITDVRYPNEAAAIQRAGGVIWRVERPETETPDLHPSEQLQAHFRVDAYLRNAGTVDELHAAVNAELVRTLTSRSTR